MDEVGGSVLYVYFWSGCSDRRMGELGRKWCLCLCVFFWDIVGLGGTGLGIWQHLGGPSPPFRFSSDWFLKHLLGFGAIFHFTLLVVVVCCCC